MITSRFDDQDNLNHFYRRIRRVSKQWQSLVEAMPRLWRHFDLSSAKKTVSRKFLSSCVRCSQGKWSAATIKFFPKNHAMSNVHILADKFQQLQYLRCLDRSMAFETGDLTFEELGVGFLNELKNTSQLTTIIIDERIACKEVTQILNHHKLLATAEFHDVICGLLDWHGDLDVQWPRLTKLVFEGPRVVCQDTRGDPNCLSLNLVSSDLAS